MAGAVSLAARCAMRACDARELPATNWEGCLASVDERLERAAVALVRFADTTDSDQRGVLRLDAFAETLGLAVAVLMLLAHVPELERVELDWVV
jgi:hypothetical protein